MGTWGQASVVSDGEPRVSPVELYSGADTIALAALLRDSQNLKPETVYYPCSGADITPVLVFPDSRVVFADQNSDVVQLLQASGYEARLGKVGGILMESVDLLFLLNPQVSAIHLLSTVKTGGFILCNNYHRTADELKKSSLCQFIQEMGELSLFRKTV